MLSLRNLTEFFDVEPFLNSMKKKPNIRTYFHFEKSVKPGKVNAYIDKLVAAGLPDSRVKLSFEDIKFLTSSKFFSELSLYGKIVDRDGIVPYEILLENVPSLRQFSIYRLSPLQLTKRFFEKFCASNLEMLSLCDLTKFFDVESFLNSMKKKPNLHIYFYFENSVDPGKVNAYIDKLVAAAGLPDSRPPDFDKCFIGSERYSQLKNLRKAYDLKSRGDF
uniref:Uncharacterized protein n=1 Tax=Panagrolaimus davidi TaxID=227884 RepID=A0A914PMN8_9BILA